MKPHVVCVIFARGGSKGVPRKNIRLLAGKPLIAHAIDVARASRHIDRVVVSTDDAEIASVAREHGAEIPFMRPAELAGDNSPEWHAWQHAIRTLEAAPGARKIDAFVTVPTTSPLRKVEDVDACIDMLLNTDADVVITVRPAERSPYFNMVSIDENGATHLIIPPAATLHTRQSTPKSYDITTVAYAARPSYVLSAPSLLAGKVRSVIVPRERAIDIDTELDFEIAEFLMSRQEHA